MSILPHIDVVTPATLRPELLKITLASFHKHVLNQFESRRLIINIDAIGDPHASIEQMLEVCHMYFDDCLYRHAEHPSFARAVRWGWEQVEADYFLHLEDDWLLKKKVDAHSALACFARDPKLALLSLNMGRNRQDLSLTQFSLRPGFMRRSFIREALLLFDEHLDPEKQFNPHCFMGGELAKWHFRYYGEPDDGRFLVDTGGKWRKSLGFDKWQGAELTWSPSRRHVGMWRDFYLRQKYRLYLRLWNYLAR
ncbi:MAG: hypothetical protein H7833_13435 [Magnetococcus sp. DMHC-1]